MDRAPVSAPPMMQQGSTRIGSRAANGIAPSVMSTQTYAPMAAIMAAGMVPPLALGLATLVARRKFDKAQQEGGKAALVLGLCFIT